MMPPAIFFLLEGNCCQHGDSERWLWARGGAQASRLPPACLPPASRRLGPQLLVHISVTVVPSTFTSWLHSVSRSLQSGDDVQWIPALPESRPHTLTGVQIESQRRENLLGERLCVPQTFAF